MTVARVDDYVSGAMSEADADAFEDELFAGAAADDAASFIDQIARMGAHMVPRGTFDVGVTRRELDALIAAGLRIQVIELGKPGHRDIRLQRDVDLVVTRFDIGLFGVDRVDVHFTLPEHGISKTMRGCKVDPEDGAIYGCCERDLAVLAFGQGRVVTGGATTLDGREILLSYEIDAVVE